jgi:mRNA interferase HigB
MGTKLVLVAWWCMRVLGKKVLDEFKNSHADARGQLDAWLVEVENATWKTPQDIKDKHRSADFLDGNRVIFNIKGNRYRLVVQVRYQNGIVVVERIGTHAEYSKWTLS